MCVEDEASPPVPSVLRTRMIDSKDIDLQKYLPFQNYFNNDAIIKNGEATEEKINSLISEGKLHKKREAKAEAKKIIHEAEHKEENTPNPKNDTVKDIPKTTLKGRVKILHKTNSKNKAELK